MSHSCEDEYYSQQSNVVHSHGHSHSHSHGHDHGHDHSSPPIATNVNQSLYQYIDTTKVKVLNGVAKSTLAAANYNYNNGIQRHKCFIKAQADKLRIDTYLESDTDCQLLIKIPFTGTCKLQSIILRTNTTNLAHEYDVPKTIKIYKNYKDSLNLDFDTVSKQKPDYEFVFPSELGVDPLNSDPIDTDESSLVEHHFPSRGFVNCHSLTLFIENNWSEDEDMLCRIYYLELRGHFMGKLEKDTAIPLSTVYESAANPLDHAPLENEQSQIGLGM